MFGFLGGVLGAIPGVGTITSIVGAAGHLPIIGGVIDTVENAAGNVAGAISDKVGNLIHGTQDAVGNAVDDVRTGLANATNDLGAGATNAASKAIAPPGKAPTLVPMTPARWAMLGLGVALLGFAIYWFARRRR